MPENEAAPPVTQTRSSEQSNSLVSALYRALSEPLTEADRQEGRDLLAREAEEARRNPPPPPRVTGQIWLERRPR